MKIGLLFAGQGSQRIGMGKDFYDRYESFRKIFDLLSEDEKKAAFEGPLEKLSDTRYTQPIMVAFAAGVTRLLKDEGIKPDVAAGLSLGEYSALAAAEVFEPEKAIELVRFRAEEMYKASIGVDCAMSALIGADRHIAEECCALVSEETGEIVQPANYNCPGQIVISGEAGAVAAASELALARGVKRAVALPVSGPFHTEFMRPAGDALNEAFKRAAFEEMTFPGILKVLGRKKKDEETISDLLIRQVSSPVLFEDSLKSMEAEAVDIMIEIGPGKALSTFAKKTCRGIDMCNIDTADDFEEVIRKLKETMREERP